MDLNKNFLHLVVSRVAIKWKNKDIYRHEEVGLSWDDWVKDSFNLYNNFCRKSLQNQSNQNFKLISLVDQDVNEAYGAINNEAYIYLNNYSNITNAIKNYIDNMAEKYEYILITRIDRDDIIKYDFIDNLQLSVIDYLFNKDNVDNFYFDIESSYIYSIEKKEIRPLDIYKSRTSHFISVLEKNDCNFKCLAYTRHDLICRKIKGKKYKNLQSIIVAHNHNIINNAFFDSAVSEQTSINLSDYGVFS